MSWTAAKSDSYAARTTRCAVLITFADEEALVQIRVKPFVVNGDVEVDNVALFDRPHVRNAVADHLVRGYADGFRELVVVQRRRVALPLTAGLVDQAVEEIAGYARPQRPRREVQYLAAKTTGFPHRLEIRAGELRDLLRPRPLLH